MARKGIKKFRSLRAKLAQSRKERVQQVTWQAAVNKTFAATIKDLRSFLLSCYTEENEIKINWQQKNIVAGLFYEYKVPLAVDYEKVQSPFMYRTIRKRFSVNDSVQYGSMVGRVIDVTDFDVIVRLEDKKIESFFFQKMGSSERRTIDELIHLNTLPNES